MRCADCVRVRARARRGRGCASRARPARGSSWPSSELERTSRAVTAAPDAVPQQLRRAGGDRRVDERDGIAASARRARSPVCRHVDRSVADRRGSRREERHARRVALAELRGSAAKRLEQLDRLRRRPARRSAIRPRQVRYGHEPGERVALAAGVADLRRSAIARSSVRDRLDLLVRVGSRRRTGARAASRAPRAAGRRRSEAPARTARPPHGARRRDAACSPAAAREPQHGVGVACRLGVVREPGHVAAHRSVAQASAASALRCRAQRDGAARATPRSRAAPARGGTRPRPTLLSSMPGGQALLEARRRARRRAASSSHSSARGGATATASSTARAPSAQAGGPGEHGVADGRRDRAVTGREHLRDEERVPAGQPVELGRRRRRAGAASSATAVQRERRDRQAARPRHRVASSPITIRSGWARSSSSSRYVAMHEQRRLRRPSAPSSRSASSVASSAQWTSSRTEAGAVGLSGDGLTRGSRRSPNGEDSP